MFSFFPLNVFEMLEQCASEIRGPDYIKCENEVKIEANETIPTEIKGPDYIKCENEVKIEVSQNHPEVRVCALCQKECILPAKLPCGHIFCFLCIKGFSNISKRCLMCSSKFPCYYTQYPQLVNSTDLEKTSAFDDGQQWFYQGYHGWWQFDDRTGTKLESAYKRGDHTLEVVIAGFLYVIDFKNMVQFRMNDQSRRRRIKRDLATISKKGIAGLRLRDNPMVPSKRTKRLNEIKTGSKATKRLKPNLEKNI